MGKKVFNLVFRFPSENSPPQSYFYAKLRVQNINVVRNTKLILRKYTITLILKAQYFQPWELYKRGARIKKNR